MGISCIAPINQRKHLHLHYTDPHLDVVQASVVFPRRVPHPTFLNYCPLCWNKPDRISGMQISELDFTNLCCKLLQPLTSYFACRYPCLTPVSNIFRHQHIDIVLQIFRKRTFKKEKKLNMHTSGSFSSIAAAVDLLLTVILEGIGKCSISSPDLNSLALFLLKLSFVGRGCNMRECYNHETNQQNFHQRWIKKYKFCSNVYHIAGISFIE